MNPNPNQVLDKLVSYIEEVLCLDDYTSTTCIEDASKLKQIVITILKNCQLHPLLVLFGHSVSCVDVNCTSTCRMFRRIRSHAQYGVGSHIDATNDDKHVCGITHVYSQLLRMHVDTCVMTFCGMHSCKDLKKMREDKGYQVLPITYAQKELTLKTNISMIPIDLVNEINNLTL